MTRSRLLPTLVLAALPAAALAQGAITAVSPGAADRASLESRCPTFSWTAVPGAESYELEVWEASAEAVTASSTPVLAKSLPGGAFSWTPARSECLRGGANYLWTVRATRDGSPSSWSSEKWFRTEEALDETRVLEALDVVRRYLDRGGSLDALGEESSAAPEPASARASRGPADRSPAASSGEQAGSDRPGSEDGVAAPTALAPKPFAGLGMDSVVDGDFVQAFAAVRGELSGEISDIGQEKIRGYLAVEVGLNEGEFDGLPQTLGVDGSEIGVLGISIGATDNYGVVGISDGGFAGRFFQSDAAGNGSNEVFLGSDARALYALGPARIVGDTEISGATAIFGSLEWDCPSSMYRVGTWCIDKIINPAANLGNSVDTCHSEGKRLCPLAALVVCDYKNTGKSASTESCGAKTDDGVGTFRTSTTRYVSGADIFDSHVAYRGNNTQTVLSDTAVYGYWCCKPVSP